jgi:hypothetical protein
MKGGCNKNNKSVQNQTAFAAVPVGGLRVPGVSGLISNAQETYAFLKANPYNQQSNAKDPISQKVFESRSQKFYKGVQEVQNEISTTKKQIRINSVTNSGTSLPKPIGSEQNQDYVGLAGRDRGFKVVQYAVIGYFLYWMFIK